MPGNLDIANGFQAKLAAIDPAIDTVWENFEYEPIAGTPFQEVYFLFAEPENPTMGTNFYRQRGFMQITLRYPANEGPIDAKARAELYRTTFARGSFVVSNGLKSIVDRTPEISGGTNIDDRYVVNVRVKFYADFHN